MSAEMTETFEQIQARRDAERVARWLRGDPAPAKPRYVQGLAYPVELIDDAKARRIENDPEYEFNNGVNGI